MPIADCERSNSVSADSAQWAIGKRQSAIIFVLAVSFAFMIPAIVWGIPSNVDLTNHFRFALPFHDALAAGDLYPSWLAESNGGYGDPSFRFYPPGLYYLLAFARIVIGNWYGAALVVFVALSLISGLGMYFWTRSILPASTAMWASFFYALAPYHVNQLYQATLLAEWAGSAILPFVFGFVERVCERGKPKDIAGLAATYGLLLFTHLPLSVIGSLALLVYALARVDGPAKLHKLAKLSLAAGLGLSLSAVYWVTMVAEMSWIGVNQVERDASVDYRLNFLLSTFSPDNLNVWWMNIIALMTLMLFVPGFLLLARSEGNKTAYRGVVALSALALFMSVPLSRPIWMLLKPLQETQFPWRWLALVSMAGSILTAAGLPLLRQSGRRTQIVLFGAMAISVVFTLSHVVREAQYFPPQKFEAMLTNLRGSESVNYWFPIWARADIREMSSKVEVADRSVSISSWRPEHREFSIVDGPATEARVKTFYYPHWIATSRGRVLPTRPDKDGALLISIPEQATSVQLDFHEPQRTKFSTMASLGGLMIIGSLAVPFRRRRP